MIELEAEAPASAGSPERRGVGPAVPRPRWWWPAHIAVFGLIAEVAFVHLGAADAAPDEFTYRACGSAYVHGNFSCNLEHPPLAKEILGVGSWIFGDSISAARATTGLVAVLTAYLCYRFCRDVAGAGAGLVAAALWGLLPQAGIEDHTTLEAVRIDRFALLDPYVACFVALARRRGRAVRAARWIGLGRVTRGSGLGGGVREAPGALIAPLAWGVPLAVRHRRGQPIARDASVIAAGALAVALISYGPLGPGGAAHAIRYMFDFQTAHSLREVVVGGHFFVTAPWWSDPYFATSATGAVLAISLALVALVGLWGYRRSAGYALGVAASIVIGVGFGLHLSAPHYFIDWEPGVIAAAALGITWCSRVRVPAVTLAAVAVSVIALIAMVETVGAANTLDPGPYATTAKVAQCDRPCVVAYVGFIDIVSNYVPRYEYLTAVPPNTRAGRVVARVFSGGHRDFLPADEVILDPAAYVLHGSWRRSIAYFLHHSTALGYERVPTGTRIELFRLRSSTAFD